MNPTINNDPNSPFSLQVLEHDLVLFDRELKSFVVPGSFDAHGHLYDPKLSGGAGAIFVPPGQPAMTRELYTSMVSSWMGSLCPVGGLFFPFPFRKADTMGQNRWIGDQVRPDAESRALLLTSPESDPAEHESLLNNRTFVGFKVYHCYASAEDTFHAPCEQFMPEWMWELAHQRGLAIMLHMVKSRALADESNQRYIREHCLRYPGAKLVLAHCARSFNARHTVEGIQSLAGLDNVFFDNSAICEAAPHEAILRTFGPTRLWFGLDHPVSSMRARPISVGDGFAWTNEIEPNWDKSRFAKPVLVGIENLLALKQACQTMHLNDRDIELVFGGAARQILGIETARKSQRCDVQAQYREAKTLIPGGTQLLSKRPEQFAPDQWPAYYEEARGCEVIDTQGRRYIDMSASGILACILGFSDPDVNAAVIRRVQMGSMATLQTHDEVELARLLIQIHPWAAMARFTRCGGEAMAVAVRIARARTGRDKVAICGYHGWHDWYLAANLPEANSGEESFVGRLDRHLLPGLEPKGVPSALAGTTLPFFYNKLEELDRAIARADGKLAAVVMETTRHVDPEPGFLEGVRERCDRIGAKLIFDEISIGWRLCLGGAHRKFGVNPDIAVFAKTISNGFAMGAVIGTADTMQAAQESFISSAYWTEGVGPAAAVAAVKKMMRIDVPSHIARIGRRMQEGWRTLGEKHRLPVIVGGRPEMVTFGFNHPESVALLTLLTARMLRHGFLAGSYFNPMLPHEERHVDAYLAALDTIFAEMSDAIASGDIRNRIGGPVKQVGFARLT